VEQNPKNDDERPRKVVRRYSANRLLREAVAVPAGATVSTEKQNGRIKVRVESPEGSRAPPVQLRPTFAVNADDATI
jgi:hypothetical protein